LPQNREQSEETFQFGYKEPRVVPNGRITIKILNEIINSYKEKKTNENLEELSSKYRIDKEKILILAEYYKTYNVLRPSLKENTKTSDKIDDKTLDIFINVNKPSTEDKIVK
jgi:hypothetical protein